MNFWIKNTRVLFALLGLFALTGCNEDAATIDQIRTQYVAIVPPNTLYECPKKPARPVPDADGKIKDSQVAEFIVKLDSAHSICSKSLKAIKAFADQAKLRVESVN
jgi:hypothetical protein